MVQPSGKLVFISYSRRDNAVMRRVVLFLRKQGITAWVDNEKLVPGTPVWEEEIEKAIFNASAIVVILSPDSKKSVWVRREISLAEQHRKRIFPVMVAGDEDSSMTLRLITSQYVDIRTDEESGLNALKTAISSYLEELEEQDKVEREAAEKAREELRAKNKKEAEQLAAQEAEEERQAKARVEAERLAKEKAKAELLAKEKADRLANQKVKEEADRIAKQEAAKVAAKNKAKRKAIASTATEFLKSQTFKRWTLIGVIGLSVIWLGTWGISNLNFDSVASPSTEFSATATITAKATSTSEEPTPTSRPLTTTDYPCTECHNDSSPLGRIRTELSTSLHWSGAPLQDCQICHQIHVTNTVRDWGLTTSEPVTLSVLGITYDGGEGNLCVKCHQPHFVFPKTENSTATNMGVDTAWGKDYGSQSAMLLGTGGSLEGKPSAHYTMVENTCVFCHMGESINHTFKADITSCQACHADANNLDINGTQTETQAMLDELGDMLVAAGVLDENSPNGKPTVTEAPENVATALFNWLFISQEDKSRGAHNPLYTKALLEASIEMMMK